MNPNPLEPEMRIRPDGVRHMSEAEGLRFVEEWKLRHNPPARAPLPCVAIEIIDEEAYHALNPLRRDGDIFPLVHAFDRPALVHADGKELCRLVPMPPGTPSNGFVIADERAIYVADPAISYADDGAVIEGYEDEGFASLREHMAQAPPASGIYLLQGCPAAHEADAVAAARREGISKEAIERELRHPIELGRALVAPCGMAKARALNDARARAVVERENAALNERIAAAGRPNDKSLAELGLEGLLADTGKLGFAWPPALVGRACWPFDGGQAVLWRAIPGYSLPADARFGYCSTLPPGAVIPAISARPEGRIENSPYATREIVELVRAIRREFLPNVHRGEIAKERWTKTGESVARALVEAHAHLLVHRKLGHHHWLPIVCEAAVRGCLTRPDRAAVLIHGVITEHFEQFRPPLGPRFGNSTAPDAVAGYEGPSLDAIAELGAAFAGAGEIELGSLLAPTKKHHRNK